MHEQRRKSLFRAFVSSFALNCVYIELGEVEKRACFVMDRSQDSTKHDDGVFQQPASKAHQIAAKNTNMHEKYAIEEPRP